MANGPFYAPGVYVCQVTDQALSKASTGTPQFVLKVKVLGKPDPKDPGSYIPVDQQYDRTIFRTITDKTIPYLTEDLKALGFTGSSFRYLDPNVEGAQIFTGTILDCYCKHENDQRGDLRERWSIARQGGGKLDVEALDAAEVRKLDALFGKQLKQQPATAPKPAPTAAPLDVSDDDVPF